MLTPETKADLEAKAKATQEATPSPWRLVPDGPNEAWVADANGNFTTREYDGQWERRAAEFVAAAHPTVVLALLAENEAQAAEIERLRDALEGAHHFVRDGMHIAAESILARALGVAPFTSANPESKTSAPPRAG